MDCYNCRKPLGVDKVTIDGVPGEYCPGCAAEYMATKLGMPQAASSIAYALIRTGEALAKIDQKPIEPEPAVPEKTPVVRHETPQELLAETGMFDDRGNFKGV